MPKHHPAKEFFPTPAKSGPEHLSDSELADRCLKNEGDTWDEFFRRFTPFIIEGIQNVILSRDRADLVHDEDVLWEIHRRVVEKLYLKGKLEQCTDLRGIRAWLRQVGRNETKDWFRERNRNKRLAEKQSTESAVSLDATLGEDTRETLGDTIPDEPPPDESVRAYLERVLDEMDDTGAKENKEWALRLSILPYLPLSDEELEALCRFSGYDIQEVTTRVRAMTREAEKKAATLAESRERRVQYWHEIKQMEGVLARKMLQNMPESAEDVQELKKKIDAKKRKQEELIKSSQNIPRPTNKSIGLLIGLSKDKVDQVSNMLTRAKEALGKKMKANDP